MTTVEMADLFKRLNIDLPNLEKSDFDDPFGSATGSGVIFGATGGVMESALRTVIELVTARSGRELFLTCRYSTHARYGRGTHRPDHAAQGRPRTGAAAGRAAPASIGWPARRSRSPSPTAPQMPARYWKTSKLAANWLPITSSNSWPARAVVWAAAGSPIPTSADIRAARARAIYAEDHAYTVRKSHENPL